MWAKTTRSEQVPEMKFGATTDQTKGRLRKMRNELHNSVILNNFESALIIFHEPKKYKPTLSRIRRQELFLCGECAWVWSHSLTLLVSSMLTTAMHRRHLLTTCSFHYMHDQRQCWRKRLKMHISTHSTSSFHSLCSLILYSLYKCDVCRCFYFIFTNFVVFTLLMRQLS